MLLPASTPIKHIPWIAGSSKDSHGNVTGSFGAAVDRMCVCWWPMHWRTGRVDPIDPDVVDRIETDIHLLVEDATVYKKGDRVIVNGLTYQVQGLPTDWGNALPFPNTAYSMLVGGEVHCRRITSTGVLAGQ